MITRDYKLEDEKLIKLFARSQIMNIFDVRLYFCHVHMMHLFSGFLYECKFHCSISVVNVLSLNILHHIVSHFIQQYHFISGFSEMHSNILFKHQNSQTYFLENLPHFLLFCFRKMIMFSVKPLCSFVLRTEMFWNVNSFLCELFSLINNTHKRFLPIHFILCVMTT